MARRRLPLLALMLLATAGSALADGFIVVPRDRPSQPQIRNVPLAVKYHHVDVTIKDQVAVTEIDQVFVNPNGWQLEGTYIFPLPEGASISKFSMFIDGKEVKAELLEKDQAREIYEGIVRRMQDPALLEYVGRRMFQARIFPIPAHGEKRLKLSYSQVLKSSAGLVEYLYPLNTEKFSSRPLESCAVNVSIAGRHAVRNVYSPTHPIEVVKKSETSVRASYEAKGVKPDTDFRLYYSQDAKDFSLNLVTHRTRGEDGYYMLLLSPGDTGGSVIEKDVVFVQDTSGSMQDDGKLDQARKALAFCLKALREGDRFGLVTFATEPQTYRDSLAGVTEENVAGALEHVGKLEAIGGTNIQEALETAIGLADPESKRPFMVVFFTDGRPTIGERNLEPLAKRISQKAPANLRLFNFGVGYDVNAPLLDRLAADNRGTTEYVAPGEELEVKVGSFFTKIASPVLADTAVSIEGLDVTDTYPKRLPDLFRGTQLAVLGRFTGEPGGKVIRLTGQVNGKPKEVVHEVTVGAGDDHDFLPRLWAIRKVGYLLAQMRTHGETAEVKNEIVHLAKRHGIVTPYTSFLVLEDERVLTDGRGETTSAPQRQADAFRAGGGGGSGAGDSSDPDADDAPADDAGLRGETGRDAVEASKKIERMRKGYGGGEHRDEELDAVLKHVGSKTFYLDAKTKTWFDSAVETDATRTEVKLFSDAYFELIKKHEDLAKYLALGKVVVQLGDTIYEITEG